MMINDIFITFILGITLIGTFLAVGLPLAWIGTKLMRYIDTIDMDAINAIVFTAYIFFCFLCIVLAEVLVINLLGFGGYTT